MMKQYKIPFLSFGLISLLCLLGCNSKHSRIEQPPKQENTKSPIVKFDVNFFLENSGSMNGYMEGSNTTFKNQLYSLLTGFKMSSDIVRSLNLLLINKGDSVLFKNAGSEELERFKDILQPNSYRKLTSQKNLGETDINDLIKRCMEKTTDKSVAILVSDCIYSPGKKVTDATKYLADQRYGIELNVASELKNRNLSIIVLNCFADFKGIYYDRYNNKIPLLSPVKRPYYIWIIGGESEVKAISDSKILERIDGGYANKIVFQCIEKNQQPDFQILPNSGAGKFKLQRGQNMLLNEAEASDRKIANGKFGFAIRADFSKFNQDKSFFLDTINYRLHGGGFRLTKIEEIVDQPPFTHVLNFETSSLADDSLKIELVSKVPTWVLANSSNDDSKIDIDPSETRKTFGLTYLIRGVQDAFDHKNKERNMGTINLKISKKHSHVGSGFLIIFLLVVVSAIIFFIIKKSR